MAGRRGAWQDCPEGDGAMTDRQTEFWDRVADRYAARQMGDTDAYEATLARVRAHLLPGMSVLELGCGTGTTALRLFDAVARYEGTDAAAQMVRIARDRAAAQGAQTLSFTQAAVTDTAGPRDAVLAFNLLHLLDDRVAALAHIRSLLPVGGLFLSKTPCLAARWWLRPVVRVVQMIGKAPPDIRFLRPADLRAEIEQAGFKIVETGDYPASLPNHFVVARAV